MTTTTKTTTETTDAAKARRRALFPVTHAHLDRIIAEKNAKIADDAAAMITTLSREITDLIRQGADTRCARIVRKEAIIASLRHVVSDACR